MFCSRVLLASCVALLITPSEGRAGDSEASFHKAYYAEVEQNDLEIAIKLYEEVIRDDRAPAELVQQAQERLDACREQLHGRDLARLMPKDILAYIELRKPGEHIARLFNMAGITQLDLERASSPRDSSPRPPLSHLVSPRLLQALKGIEGAAIAITDVDTRRGIPTGLVVIHPGRNDLVHGLVETALSFGMASHFVQAGDPIQGHRTFTSPHGSVVVTKRLIIAGNPHQLVVEAVERLHRDPTPALDDLEPFAQLAPRREDSLLFAFVNARRVLEKAKAEITRHGDIPEEYRIAQAVADVESLRWAALMLGTCDQGIFGNLQLRLDRDNHALVYHLARTPPMEVGALKAIPSGAAGFLGFALSDKEASVGTRSRDAEYVTGLDIGREIFDNINHVLAFILPGGSAQDPPRHPGIPDIGVVLTVREGARSRILWKELLGLAATMIKADPNPVRTENVDGREVQIYAFPESIQLYVAPLSDRIILASSKNVLSEAFKAVDGKACILSDSAFAEATTALTSGMNKIVMVHAGRAFQIAKPFLEFHGEEARLIADLLKDRTVTVFTDEKPFALEAGFVVGVPKVGGVIQQILAQRGAHRGAPRGGMRRTPRRVRERGPVQKIIPRGGEWKYLDRGTDEGTAWREPQFDDSAWKSGPAPIGYGEDYLATTVGFGEDEENKYVTTYFRRSFELNHPERFRALRIQLYRDDSAAVYINGTEVVRDNLPPGAAYDVFAPRVIGGDAERACLVFPVAPNALRSGKNTVAVEIHQHDRESSDIIFDLALEGTLKEDPSQAQKVDY